MNYFPFDPCPRASAVALDDKRLTRVFHEATMALSVARNRLTGELGPYSPQTPVPRAIVDWICGEGETWFVEWTREMAVAMIERNGPERVNGYACFQAYQRLPARFVWPSYVVKPATFPNLACSSIKGLDFRHLEDTHQAYRHYVLAQWDGLDRRPCSWTHHGPPSWANRDLAGFLSAL